MNLRKVLSFVCALALAFSLSVSSAFAATSPSGGTSKVTVGKQHINVALYKVTDTAEAADGLQWQLATKSDKGNKVTYKKVKGCGYFHISSTGKIKMYSSLVTSKCKKHKCSGHAKNSKYYYVWVKATAAKGKGYAKATKTFKIRLTLNAAE